MKTLIPVVLYLRMSSDKQECSIDDQRKALTDHCRQHGYRIVTEYLDEGISGWKSKQRLGFQQLIADAPKREFQAVVCWDQSRFSRFDPMEANYFWHILRREDVRIETIKEGRLDLDSLGGWLTASISQHGKAEYVKSMAIDIARGQRRQRALGYWLNFAPYGYRKQPGKNAHLELGPAAEVDLVRRVFQMRKDGFGYRSIVATFNQEGIKSAYGGNWHQRVIKDMTRRQTYLGHTLVGAESNPKFATKAEVKLIKNTHPAIIDQETFDVVQKMNETLQRGRGPSVRSGRQSHALAGLVRCGCCGSTMFDRDRQDWFICSGYQARGVCTYNHVPRGKLLELIASKIREEVLLGSLDKLTAAVEKAMAKRRTIAPKTDLGDVRRQIAAIDAKLETAAERLMTIVPSLVPTIEAKMVDLQRQREVLAAKLDEKPVTRKATRTAADIAADLWRLDEVLRKGSPNVVRVALSKLIKRIDVNFAASQSKGKAVHWLPSGGALHFSNAGTWFDCPRDIDPLELGRRG